jgi:hypothetical protein
MPPSRTRSRDGTLSEVDSHVEELAAQIPELKDQIRLLRMALDEFHTDFMWAVQNMRSETPPSPPFHMTSMPLEEVPVTSPETADVPEEFEADPAHDVVLPEEVREQQPVSSPRRGSPKQPLYMRIMQRHMTDIVRAIRYDEVSLDEVHARLAPLMETYGRGKVEEGAKELIEPVPGEEGMYRLAAVASPYALQLIGRPPPEPGESSPPEGASATEPKLPRDRAIQEFKRWLIVTQRSFTNVPPKTVAALRDKKVLVPDGIVDGTELVTVRQMISAKQRSDMHMWLTHFGDDYEAVRAWKREGPEGATWTWEVIATAEDE